MSTPAIYGLATPAASNAYVAAIAPAAAPAAISAGVLVMCRKTPAVSGALMTFPPNLALGIDAANNLLVTDTSAVISAIPLSAYLDTWVLITATLTGGVLTVYLNGVLSLTLAVVTPVGAPTFFALAFDTALSNITAGGFWSKTALTKVQHQALAESTFATGSLSGARAFAQHVYLADRGMRPSSLVWPDEGSVGGVALTLSVGTTPLLGAVTAGDFLVTDGNSGGDGTNLVERYFVYSPAGVAMGNVYTDWATMFAAIALLPIGEQPVVSVVDTTGVPLPVPLAGMPVNGWDMRGGSIVSFYRATGQVTLDAPAGVKFDMLLEIGNGLVLTVAPPAGTGVLEFSLIPDGGAFIFTVGLGAAVINSGAGALLRSRGNPLAGSTNVIALFGCSMGALFLPASAGPLIELVADDGAVLSFVNTLGGVPVAPAAGPVLGGGPGSNLIVIADSSATLPSEWSPDYTGGTPPFVFLTMRNGLQGTTALRPTAPPMLIGTTYFDTDVGFPIWWNGTIWVDAAGAPA